jgi:hypothetical protein
VQDINNFNDWFNGSLAFFNQNIVFRFAMCKDRTGLECKAHKLNNTSEITLVAAQG